MTGKAFSGKQKKEQLKAKRQKKRSEGEHRDDVCCEDESDSDVQAAGNIMSRDVAQKEESTLNASGSASARAPRGVSNATTTLGGDKPGVRSIFQKESVAAIEARKRLSYEPLLRRDFTPGVPFGEYFSMIGTSSANLEERHFSTSFPFTLALPTRSHFVVKHTTDVDDGNAAREGESSGDEEHRVDLHKGVCKGSGARPDKGKLQRNRKKQQEVHRDPEVTDAGVQGASSSAKRFEQEEERVFQDWMDRIDHFPLPPALKGFELNSFERNVDVWRQLWRTVEASDVVVCVADCRYPIVHLPISLLHFIVVLMKKRAVVCMNKADLVPPSIVQSWTTFLQRYFVTMGVAVNEGDIPFVSFTSLPEADTAFGSESMRADKRRKAKKRTTKQYEEMKAGCKRRGDNLLAPTSAGDHSNPSGSDEEEEEGSDNSDAYDTTANFKGKEKAEKQLSHGRRNFKELQEVAHMIDTLLTTCKRLCPGTDDDDNLRRSEDGVTIGVVGHPNVGKSSLINAIRGTKVVSVSSSAGHTKHLQTIPIPQDGVTLVDCPGLAFPVLGLPRPLQAVIGTHQIAQTRDPQSGVAYLAARLPLEKIYGLRKIDADESEPWSPYELCESFAVKKGFMVKRGKGVADIHRAAIAMLQEAYEGRLVLYFAAPPVEWLESSKFVNEIKSHLLMFPLPIQ